MNGSKQRKRRGRVRRGRWDVVLWIGWTAFLLFLVLQPFLQSKTKTLVREESPTQQTMPSPGQQEELAAPVQKELDLDVTTSGEKPSGECLILVNRWNPLPEDWSLELVPLRNGHFIDRRAYPDLQRMMDAARGEGLSPLICSSYRTREKQTRLYENQVRKQRRLGLSPGKAREEAARWVAIPGTSEHETGLAVDIVSSRYQGLDRRQEETPEQRWLMEHCWEYGFILRYPNDKSDRTGIHYEPWHYRYVGREAAQEMKERRICLEEYLSES